MTDKEIELADGLLNKAINEGDVVKQHTLVSSYRDLIEASTQRPSAPVKKAAASGKGKEAATS